MPYKKNTIFNKNIFILIFTPIFDTPNAKKI